MTTNKKQLEVIKCISCTAISHNDTGVCDSCDNNDIHSTIIGQTININIFTEDTDLAEWCEENSWDDHVVESVDHEGGLVWAKNIPYSIQIQDII